MYQLSVFIHIFSAIIWVGGMFFLALVVVPTTRHLPPAERGALFNTVGVRFRTIGWVCIGLLILTGLINSAYRGVTWESLFSGQILASSFGRLLMMKLGLVVVMLILSVFHDFFLGPASTRALQRHAPDEAPKIERLRRQASVIGRVNGLLALAVLALAVMLVRGAPSL